MIPVALLFGLLLTPVIGIIGIIYEKVKNDENIWYSIAGMIISWFIFVPAYLLIVSIFIKVFQDLCLNPILLI